MINAGDKVAFSVKSSGGKGKIKYKFCVKQKYTSLIKEYTTSKSAKWIPDKSGKYTISVTAKDSEGNTVSRKISSYIVNPKLKISKIKTSVASGKAITGKNVKFAISATGGGSKYQYKLTCKRKGEKKTKVVKGYSSKKNIVWVPEKSGKYTIYAYVRDKATGKVAKKTITSYEVKS